MATVTFTHGNSETTQSVIKTNHWQAGENIRVYFELSSDAKTPKSITSLYQIVSGSTRDKTVTFGGRTYGYQLGVGFDSKTKRAAAAEAVLSLVKQIAEEEATK